MKKKIIPVTCAIIHFGNKILAVQRSKLMILPLKWEFPGGKIQSGESEKDCVKREIWAFIFYQQTAKSKRNI